MSQHAAQPMQPQFMLMQAPQGGNALGVFGFLLALVGLVIPTGIVALLGLTLSLAAIGRAPRGFATLGVMIGLLGSVLWLLVDLLVLLAAVVGLGVAGLFGAVAFTTLQPEIVEISRDMVRVAVAVEEYASEHDAMPEDLGVLPIGLASATDPWGGSYRLVSADSDHGFDIVSGGPDRTFDTDDDVRGAEMDHHWEQAFETFGERLERFGEHMEARHADHVTITIDPDEYEWRAQQAIERERGRMDLVEDPESVIIDIP